MRILNKIIKKIQFRTTIISVIMKTKKILRMEPILIPCQINYLKSRSLNLSKKSPIKWWPKSVLIPSLSKKRKILQLSSTKTSKSLKLRQPKIKRSQARNTTTATHTWSNRLNSQTFKSRTFWQQSKNAWLQNIKKWTNLSKECMKRSLYHPNHTNTTFTN